MALHKMNAVNASTTKHHPGIHRLPYGGASSLSSSPSNMESELLKKTTPDTADASAGDFDFEELFICDEPQKKLKSVVEVSIPTRERDRSNFSFSYYASGRGAGNEMSKNESDHLDMRNKGNAGNR
ncbi:uncharacterized protein Z519_12312 [Cladophialophora bantiana CBS 173.52]|uniref:Uncharacterized protein n=1 Tax=Cladophialophora bantiana (strain ATCC 10958 / CBS 173.52 / CDC B-1940 / NIH 8579) TaxID=1442370 RepID=A0A0D2H855_CLAB1|nr:uncharacterized protein Z519_12312 [Cladophialophora bantiana CBS 173.52]KIW87015.1 hypothetical protein Z519_12312 [Cladophialophora bantiana CBS 173.52]